MLAFFAVGVSIVEAENSKYYKTIQPKISPSKLEDFFWKKKKK